jgi:long-chain acyl-CoA synthetase
VFTHKVYDALIFKKMRAAIGGKVRLIITGSAPISSEVQEFLRIALCCNMIEGYGQTESSAASFCQRLDNFKTRNVGGPCTNTEFRLQNVDEMNYTADDMDE